MSKLFNSNTFLIQTLTTIPILSGRQREVFAGVFLTHKLILCDEKWHGEEMWCKGGSPTNLDSKVLVICFLIRFHPNSISLDPN